MYLCLGSFPALVVSSAEAVRDESSSAEAVREVMRTHDLVCRSRLSLKVGRVLIYNSEDLALSPYGEHWRKMRKLCVTHMLSSKMVDSFGVMRKEEVRLMLEKIVSIIYINPKIVNNMIIIEKILISYKKILPPDIMMQRALDPVVVVV